MSEVNKEPRMSEFKCGGTEAGHMWAESNNDQDSALYLGATFEEAFKIHDISSVFHYEQLVRKDLQSFYVPGQQTGECAVFDEVLCEDEMANLPLAVCLPKASEDQILNTDVDFSKMIPELDFKFYDELSSGDSTPANRSIETGIQVAEVSESSILEPKFLKSTACALHNVSRSKSGDEIKVEDGLGLTCPKGSMNVICSNICGAQDAHKINDEHCAESDEASPVNQIMNVEDPLVVYQSTNSCSAGKIMSCRHKRLCHPPKKYVEESPMLKPRKVRPRKYATNSSKDEDHGVGLQKNHRRKVSKRKASKESETDDEYKPHASCSKYRRACITKWTVDEAVKVVDGVAQLGRAWTAIQNSFFPSSCRSPTDIRDKWRNLVKTYCTNLKRTRKDQHQRKDYKPLPAPVIERLREIAKSIP